MALRYSPGATLGDGTAGVRGHQYFSESAICSEAVYFYDIFAYKRRRRPNHKLHIWPLVSWRGVSLTLANPATTQATNLVLPNGTITNNQVVLNWTNGMAPSE